MSYEIQDRLSLKVLFNGEEFLFGRANSLEFLHMVQSTKIGVPMLHMALQDNVGFLSQSKHLGDGAIIQIILSSRSEGKTTSYVFRLNSFKPTPNSGAYRYEIDGYLNCPVYWHASQRESIEGTSKSVLSKIAALSNLYFSGDETSDDQIWIPGNRYYYAWAQEIASRGFRSDNSCMQLALNLNRLVTYKDISAPSQPTERFNFGGYLQGTLLASDVTPMLASGTLNHHAGYADMLVEQDTEVEDSQVNSKVQVSLQSSEGGLQVNSNVKGAVERSTVRLAPIDVGNVHPNYEKAFYQNRRISSLFSTQVSVVTPALTGLNCLDTVGLTVDQAYDYLQSYSGNYRVGSRTIWVSGNDYFEKLALFRRTINGRIVGGV